jgi:cyanophycinase
VKRTLFFWLSLILVFSPAVQAGPKGHLLIIGGGERTEALMKRFISLAAGFGNGKIVIFTMATAVPGEVHDEVLAEYIGYGVRDFSIHHLTRREAMMPETIKILDGAGGVFFTGGDQSRLAGALLETPVLERILGLYEAGCVIGGTSAGAAVMSEVMIIGEEKRTADEDELWETIWADNVVIERGFGFIKNSVIDQHFVTRRRHNRLISTAIEHPELLGAGIEESTAVLVRPDGKWEIIGENQVIVYDARNARILKSPPNLLGAHGMAMHVLLPGDVFDPLEGRVEKPAC